MDMPITVPRASVTEAADDLKVQDALLRQFPEVESVIGKAGRADTPTDPAPLDMVETFVNFRPRELWPQRVLKFDDAARQTRAGAGRPGERRATSGRRSAEDRDALVNDATMARSTRFDETMRALALQRYREFENGARARADPLRRRRRRCAASAIAAILHWPDGCDEKAEIDAAGRTT